MLRHLSYLIVVLTSMALMQLLGICCFLQKTSGLSVFSATDFFFLLVFPDRVFLCNRALVVLDLLCKPG